MNYILLFGMPGGGELFFIVLIIIMLFGSKKIPELARGLGKGMREIKNATGDIQREIREGAKDINIVKDSVDVEKQVKDMIKGEEVSSPSVVDNKTTENNTEQSKPGNKQEETINQQQETGNKKPISQTVQRRNHYTTEDSQTPTDQS